MTGENNILHRGYIFRDFSSIYRGKKAQQIEIDCQSERGKFVIKPQQVEDGRTRGDIESKRMGGIESP